MVKTAEACVSERFTTPFTSRHHGSPTPCLPPPSFPSPTLPSLADLVQERCRTLQQLPAPRRRLRHVREALAEFLEYSTVRSFISGLRSLRAELMHVRFPEEERGVVFTKVWPAGEERLFAGLKGVLINRGCSVFELRERSKSRIGGEWSCLVVSSGI